MTETVGTPESGVSGAAPGRGRKAAKPARAAGLTVERIHTTPGVHPYDEVTWERRDVVMTNWRDGTVNFEQRGVEFPDSWSVNATNIVTSKYFRGAVGSPVRESSLRQLIDRVVGVYHASGVENGYFATDADAGVFAHELTWMLLHQVFSFNSPVWFNVGTSSPNQVSACFILAVDDTMESILNWYREEGLIFKGGSGAGLNLSRIRSSKELLSSGGTASGPVSFMRGADASAGTIKSGGATRRAAKMVVLDVDHPDIEEFVLTKAKEEAKVRVLRDAGFDMDLGGSDITSVQYQNANNSVRVTDEFMRAVEADTDFGLRARMTGEIIEKVGAKKLFRTIAQAAWECADPGIQYDGTINDWHTCPESGRISASNPCSEYMHLDNSSCNLASLNLLTFLGDNGQFDAVRFQASVELIITAMDISICFADFPTEPIGDTTRRFRQLGIGYANLGALLMATGHAYDSEGGRALAGAITSLMTGAAYKRSAELAGVVGPYDGYARNAESHQRVMRKHAAANDDVRTSSSSTPIHKLATIAWKDCLAIGARHGWRNAQASVLAPTGCLTADTLVTTDRGLIRLGEVGDVYGDRWQDLDMSVSTDEGPRRATKFFVNGEEPTRRIVTQGGFTVQGTLAHRIKVVEPDTGDWVWRRMADIAPGDLVPLQMRTMVGQSRRVPLPVLDQAYYTSDTRLVVPDSVDADLAELVGYFMGDGSLHAKGLRFCVADADLDVVERLRILGKQLFGLEASVTAAEGYHEVGFTSVRLGRWWQAAGFAKHRPNSGHEGKGWSPHVPSAILESNDPEVYATFVRGLFEADGTVADGVPSFSTASNTFAAEVRTVMLALGMATTTRETVSGFGGAIFQVRLRNLDHVPNYDEIVGHGVDYLFEPVAENVDGGVQPTYDLSVPDNVTYVAAGFVSHNTIGLMMDCDTTGIEPDLALVKFKKLVGGGSMQIVNQTVPRALARLGYQPEQVEAIVSYVGERGHVIDAPALRQEHYEVFDCAMGERVIAAMGHVRMMAAVQPFLSGAISKTVNMPETATVEDVERVYLDGWRLGLKALAIYRDNCKVGQPLSVGRSATSSGGGQKETVVVEARPVRRRLPKKRPSETVSFTVGGAEGYLTAGSYPDDGLGEIFVKLGKQGSTLSGVMDAFSMSISVGLQYGIPLEFYVSKFSNLRFEPAGMTDDPDVRIATSVLDYLFRRLALDHLPAEKRAQLGIFSADERTAQVSEGYGDFDVEGLRGSVDRGSVEARSTPAVGASPAPVEVGSSTELLELRMGKAADAPLCMTCGTKMRPAGSCYLCEGCGSTSGCS